MIGGKRTVFRLIVPRLVTPAGRSYCPRPTGGCRSVQAWWWDFAVRFWTLRRLLGPMNPPQIQSPSRRDSIAPTSIGILAVFFVVESMSVDSFSSELVLERTLQYLKAEYKWINPERKWLHHISTYPIVWLWRIPLYISACWSPYVWWTGSNQKIASGSFYKKSWTYYCWNHGIRKLARLTFFGMVMWVGWEFVGVKLEKDRPWWHWPS